MSKEVEKLIKDLMERLDYHLDETVHISVYERYLERDYIMRRLLERVKRFLYSQNSTKAKELLKELEDNFI